MIRLYRLWKHDRAMFKMYRAHNHVCRNCWQVYNQDAGDAAAAKIIWTRLEVMLAERSVSL